MAAGLCYGSRRGGARQAFHHRVGAYDTETLIGARRTTPLPRRAEGDAAVGRAAAHRSHAMGAWLRRQRSWLVVEPLPAYAPESNPVEPLWASLRGWSWLTWPVTPWMRSSRRLSVASRGSGPPTIWASRSCATAACPCGEPTTMSLEGANIPAVDRPVVRGTAKDVSAGTTGRRRPAAADLPLRPPRPRHHPGGLTMAAADTMTPNQAR
jgi:hypothetical protein